VAITVLPQTLVVAQPGASENRSGSLNCGDAQEIEPESIDPLTNPEWDRAVLSHPKSNVFHLSAWARVLTGTYGHRPFYFQFSQQGKLAALLPIMEVNSVLTGVRGVSLPFSDFSNPLIFDPSVNVVQLLNGVNRITSARKWKYFETRSNAFNAAFSNCTEQYYGHKLDLTVGSDRLFANLAASVRRAIRKAKKSGLDIEVSKSWRGMLDFYRLHLRTRQRHGVPPQSLSFFRNIHREIITAGYGFVVVAKAAMRPIAAAVFFHSGREALYKFGASDAGAQILRGNNLVMWKAIEHLAALGFGVLHFGRTALADEGLRQFKRSWGTVEHTLEYHRSQDSTHSTNPRLFPRGHGLYTRVFRKLPLIVNRAVGTVVYPHLD
jgi:lipid II:glycine glycyltransferase (peptidoglycan interpeptide bridge formation enzyme)